MTTADAQVLPVQARTALVVHGGAGVSSRASISNEDEIAVRQALDRALDAGQQVLASGGTALDAVTAAVVVLEDSPWFNAGKGSVFDAEGRHELDASIMEGHTRRAGAVAALTTVKNPVLLSRAVLEHSEHVMLVSAGAENSPTHARTSSASSPPTSTPTVAGNNCSMPVRWKRRRPRTACREPISAPWVQLRWMDKATSPPPRPPAA